MRNITAAAILFLAFATLASAQSARQYIEIDETKLTDNSYALLGRPEVRLDLAMTTKQVASFRRLLATKPNQRTTLADLLTATQQQRLRQLLVQMKGSAIVAVDPEIQTQLEITPEQHKNISQTMEHYDYFRVPFVRRYGRQLVAGITDQTIKERKAEVDALALEITQLLKERDKDIFRILTEAQRQKLRELEGKPLPIKWPEHNLVFGETFVE